MIHPLLPLLLLCVAQESREPHLGYLYPAGGQQGTVVQVFAGGQLLNGVKEIVVSGEGVRARVVRYMGRIVFLNGDQRRELMQRLKDIKSGKTPEKKDDSKLQNHPLFKDLESLSPLETEFLVNEYLKVNQKKQLNPQLGETALIEVTVDANAAPGERELRLRTALGLTNPLNFQVGRLPEIREPEPYNVEATPGAPLDLPVAINGQIRPGDVDRFRLQAKSGQRLVVQAYARRLIPFLADAVPGWFQATLTLFDSKGKELAFNDDYRLEPDPVVQFQVPDSGVYELEIRDALYRGREDFVYRITVEEGAVVGKDALAGRDEVEPNDEGRVAQRIELPRTIEGRIATPGDVDVFQFEGKAGREIVAEITARRLRSSLDSLLRLTDGAGRVVAWNDDLERKDGDLRTDMGAITHHADSYLRATLPQDGLYYVAVSDTAGQGGEAYGYRLRVGPPQPDFSLRVTPATLNVRSGVAQPITVYALRQDGFDGEIEVTLKDAPAGFKLQGATIPAGRDRVRMTLTTSKPPDAPLSLRIEGRSGAIVRDALPCDDMMQAFLWRHLVPCRDLLVAGVGGGGRIASPELVGKTPVRISPGGSAEVVFKTAAASKLEEFQFVLEDPPKGMTLQEVLPTKGGLKLVLKAEQAVEMGAGGNLIVGVYVTQNKKKERRFFVGVLPAVPFRIVKGSEK